MRTLWRSRFVGVAAARVHRKHRTKAGWGGLNGTPTAALEGRSRGSRLHLIGSLAILDLRTSAERGPSLAPGQRTSAVQEPVPLFGWQKLPELLIYQILFPHLPVLAQPRLPAGADLFFGCTGNNLLTKEIIAYEPLNYSHFSAEL